MTVVLFQFLCLISNRPQPWCFCLESPSSRAYVPLSHHSLISLTRATEIQRLRLMNYSILFLILILTAATTGAYGQVKPDSIREVLSITKDTARVQALTDLAMELIYTNPQESERFASEAITLSEQIDYPLGIAKAYHALSISHDIRGNYQQAVESAKAGIAVTSPEQNGDKERTIYSSLLNVLGLAYYHQSKYNLALNAFFEALEINADHWPKACNLYNNIGLCYHDLGDLAKAQEYYEKSFELAEKSNLAIQAGRAANNVGLIYGEKKDYPSAIRYYELALKYKTENGDENGKSATYLNLGVTYKKMEDFENAWRFLDYAETIKVTLNDKLGLLNVQDAKTDILIKQKRFDEAAFMANQNLALLDSLNTAEPRITVFNSLYKLFDAQGNYQEALKWHVATTNLKDSLFTVEKNKQALEIESRYETEKKEQTIIVTPQTWRFG